MTTTALRSDGTARIAAAAIFQPHPLCADVIAKIALLIKTSAQFRFPIHVINRLRKERSRFSKFMLKFQSVPCSQQYLHYTESIRNFSILLEWEKQQVKIKFAILAKSF
jgi:hypothetical protein